MQMQNHANAIKDVYEKMEERNHKNNATSQQQQQQQQQRDLHEIRDPHGMLDLLTSTSMRSRL